MKLIHKFALFSFIIFCWLGSSFETYALDIQSISVRGNTLLPESTILQQIESRVGGLYKPELISKDIQHIYDLGLFLGVDVDVQERDGGISLSFLVEERPIISKIEFQGNKKIKDDQLEEVLTLSPADIADPLQQKFYPQTIAEDIEHIKQLYHEQGYHNALIRSQILPDSSSSQEKVILRYTIEERKKAAVRSIEFVGNSAFSGKQLRKQMSTRKKGFFSFLTGSGKYEETAFESDLERIKFFYSDHGYIDVKVIDYSLDFARDSSDLFITITLDEGDIYTINRVNMSGNTVYSPEEIQKVINVAPEDPFSRTAIQKDIVAISDVYAQKGYLTPISENTKDKLLIDPEITIDREKRQVDLTYGIREGSPHFLNRLTIAGNQKTRDKVIRRELNFHEGELVNSKKMKRSQQKVFNLGFFDDIEFVLADGAEEKTVDLNIDVTEGSRGSFNFGGGWSSVDNWIVSGGFTTPNLFGRAHRINFSATLGGKSQTFNLSYTVPRFLDSPYTVGIDGYKTKRQYSAYDSNSTGAGLRLGRRISDHIFGTLKYEYKEVDITDVEDDASAVIKAAEGLSETSSSSLLLKRSTINNVLLPTKGMLTKLSGEVAGGILQGENDFYKIILDHNIYFPLYKDLALRFKNEFAYAKEYGGSEEVPIFERFFGGGADVIRGYEERSIGPEDENGDNIGGDTRIISTAEIIIPVRKELRLVTFFDMGDVYGSDEDIDISTFKKSVGAGIRFFSPFGLIRIDWGYKLEKESGEDPYEIHFGIGAPF